MYDSLISKILPAEKANHFIVYRPDDDNDAIKDVIGVPQVLKEAKGSQF